MSWSFVIQSTSHILFDVIDATGLGQIFPGVNVSDRHEDWEHNYRCPDIVAFLKGTAAVNHGTHWTGGPDLVIEIILQAVRFVQVDRELARPVLPLVELAQDISKRRRHISPHDVVRDKLTFYGKIGTRELIIVDRGPWQLERYQLVGEHLVLAGTSNPENPAWLACDTVPLKCRLQSGNPRPRIEVQSVASDKTWHI